jgi:hypothetical protein
MQRLKIRDVFAEIFNDSLRACTVHTFPQLPW